MYLLANLRRAIAKLLVREGYLKFVEDVTKDNHKWLRIGLKYRPKRKPLINSIKRISKSGRPCLC